MSGFEKKQAFKPKNIQVTRPKRKTNIKIRNFIFEYLQKYVITQLQVRWNEVKEYENGLVEDYT